MNEELTTGQVIDALDPYMSRLSGIVYVDTVLVLDTEADAVVEEESISYDDWGFSDPDKWGCVQNRDLNEAIKDMLENGNEFEQEAARGQSQWLCVIIPNRPYDSDVKRNLYQNMMKAHFIPRDRNTPYTLMWFTDFDEDGKSGGVVPNHMTVGRGNFGNPAHSKWESVYVAEMAAFIIKKMKWRAGRLEYRAGQKGKAPRVGPS